MDSMSDTELRELLKAGEEECFREVCAKLSQVSALIRLRDFAPDNVGLARAMLCDAEDALEFLMGLSSR